MTPDGPWPVPHWLTGEGLDRLRAVTGSPRLTAGEPGRPAAVLVLLGPAAEPPHGTTLGAATVLLTRRSAALRSHAGQISFPGGRSEPQDAGAADTALREAGEEVGLARDGVHVIAELPVLSVVPSNHSVTPVLAWWARPVPLVPGGPEVAAVARVGLATLADPAHRVSVRHPSGTAWPAFDLPDGWFVWGFTAWVLDGLLAALGLAGDWDRDRTVDLPVSP